MLRGAIIGTGNVALKGHVPGWRSARDVAIVAAADTRPEGRTAAEAAIPGIRTFAEASELIERETPDFVDVCTPPSSHAAIVEAALRAGTHVLCEKPLVTDVEDIARLRLASSAADRALVTVHNWRHAPILAAVEDIVRSGRLGPIRRCRWETLRTRPAEAAGPGGGNWRVDPAVAGGGVLVDHGWHALYMIHGWLGAGAASLRAELSTRRHAEWPIEDTARVRLEYAHAEAEIFLTWASDRRENAIEIEGERGSLRMRGSELELARFGPGGPDNAERSRFPASLAEGSQHPEWFQGVVREFLGEISDPALRGRNLAEAAFCAGAIAAARASSGRGGAPEPIRRGEPGADRA